MSVDHCLREEFLLEVARNLASSCAGPALLRGSLAANLAGWASRCAADIDLVVPSPREEDLFSLQGLVVAGLSCEIVSGPARLRLSREDVEVFTASLKAVDARGTQLWFGVDVGTQEFPYPSVPVGGALRRLKAEWLFAEKVAVVHRRFAKRKRLSDVRCRDVIDVCRWRDVTFEGRELEVVQACGLFDKDSLGAIARALASGEYPHFWLAELRKDRGFEKRLGVGTLSEMWSAVVERLHV